MRQETRQDIARLLERVEEVRSLLSLEPKDYSALEDEAQLVGLCSELVEALETTRRGLIETNTKLSALRETAEGMLSAVRPEEATQTVRSYMHRVLGFEEIGLWVMNRENGTLEGGWSRVVHDERESLEHSFAPLEAEGELKSTLWSMQTTTVSRDEIGNQLGPWRFEGVSEVTIVPLVSSRQWLPCKEVKKCIRQECRAYFAEGTFCWETPSTLCFHEKGFDMSRREEFCLRCDVFPLLGLMVLESTESKKLSAVELSMVESLAYNVSRVLESNRLYGVLEVGEEFRAGILRCMGECLVALDLDGRVVTFNRMAEAVTGFGVDEAVGREASFLVPSEQKDESPIHMALRQGAEMSSVVTSVARRSGGTVPVRMTTRLLQDGRGYVNGVIATFTDERPARRVEAKMRQLDRLAALGRFASSVAHELRNPLSGIAAGIQYMKKQVGDRGPHADNVGFLLREIARLEKIIDDLLKITHPQELILSEASLADVVERALKCLAPNVSARGVDLDFSVKGTVPDIKMDVDQMQQVVINLVKNALEAVDEAGRVTIELGLKEDETDGTAPAAVLTVTDSGAGITKADLERVFEPFFTTKATGTGLGLFISHDIVQRHAGELTVTSEPDKGSCFRVQLPLPGQAEQQGA
ncbi:MAG: PAS domain S-box protein [Candidatus Eiseniibacteriota bacterium]|nr:MAG: PAS domain S-box protein [Candidatus Eisenbacteria bacterium]